MQGLDGLRAAQWLIVLVILWVSACAAGNEEQKASKPEVIEIFACSDYCPGPRSKYMKKVYEGVSDEESCLKLGGKPYTYTGWGTYFACVAE